MTVQELYSILGNEYEIHVYSMYKFINGIEQISRRRYSNSMIGLVKRIREPDRKSISMPYIRRRSEDEAIWNVINKSKFDEPLTTMKQVWFCCFVK